MQNEDIFAQLESYLSPRTHAKMGLGIPELSELKRRGDQIDAVRAQMKTEFAGLDRHIDQIVDLVKPWFVLPQAQRRPTVISLWGMTGVGKSSFVIRLVELLEQRASYGYVDLGKAVEKSSVRMESTAPFPMSIMRLSGGPGIMFFDEMHSVRTVSEMGEDIDRPQLCDFWTLIDSGVVMQSFEGFRHLIHRNTQEVRELSKPDTVTLPEQVYGLDENVLDHVISLLELKTTVPQLRTTALKNPIAYFNWANQKLEAAMREMVPLDFSQCLIFTAGNLDEVYRDSFSLNPDDMNADDLFEKTSKIGPDRVKQALLRRFRPEQVARLGSMQVVFPSLSKAAFQSLIRLRLKDIADWMQKSFKLNVTFDASVIQLLLAEGVVPAQGARPVLSTIAEYIEIRTAGWVIAASTGGHAQMTIAYETESQMLVCHSGTVKIHEQHLALRKDRLPDMDVQPAMADTIWNHEAGHAVLGISELGLLPVKVLTGSASWHRGGPRVEFRSSELMTKDSAMELIATLLGGIAAEKMIYGADNFSTGSTSDLQRATEIAATIITQCGMGSHLSVSIPPPAPSSFTSTNKLKDDQEVEKLLNQAMARAEKVLRQQRPLFDAIVDQLKNNDRVTSHDLAATVKEHFKGPAREVELILLRKYPRSAQEILPEPLITTVKPSTKPKRGSLKKAA